MAEFRKKRAISSIFIKTFWILFLVKDLKNILFIYLNVGFWEHTFLLWCDVWKMDDFFQPHNFEIQKSFWDIKSQILETTKYAFIRPSFYTHRKSNDIEDANSWKKRIKVSLINWLVLQQSPFNIFSPVLAFKVNLTLNRCGIYQFTILWIQYSALAGRGK